MRVWIQDDYDRCSQWLLLASRKDLMRRSLCELDKNREFIGFNPASHDSSERFRRLFENGLQAFENIQFDLNGLNDCKLLLNAALSPAYLANSSISLQPHTMPSHPFCVLISPSISHILPWSGRPSIVNSIRRHSSAFTNICEHSSAIHDHSNECQKILVLNQTDLTCQSDRSSKTCWSSFAYQKLI